MPRRTLQSPRQSCAPHSSPPVLGAGDHGIQFLAGYLKVVPQADMAGIHQTPQSRQHPPRASLLQPAACERFRSQRDERGGGLLAPERQPGTRIVRRQHPAGWNRKEPGRRLTLSPTLVVRRVDQATPAGGVHHDKDRVLWQRHRSDLQGATIDEQGMVGTGLPQRSSGP